MIITRTPLRISLVGGSTDMPAFYEKHPGAVVSFSVNKYVYVTLNPKFDGRMRVSYSETENVDSVSKIHHDLVRESLKMNGIESGYEITSVADVPGNGTGLGSSSSFTVGLLKALAPDDSPGTLAERAFVVEADKCGHHCGKQDQYAAAFGGLNYITFQKRSVKVTPILKGIEWYDDFERHALLLWTGIARKNEHTQILERQAKAFRDGTNANYGVVVAQQAAAFHTAIVLDESMEKLGKLLDDAWKVKRYLVDGIANETIDRYYDVAMRHGAYGGKLLGAGGGGFIFLLAPPDMHETICNRTGLPKIDFKIEPNGSEVIYETQDVVRR